MALLDHRQPQPSLLAEACQLSKTLASCLNRSEDSHEVPIATIKKRPHPILQQANDMRPRRFSPARILACAWTSGRAKAPVSRLRKRLADRIAAPDEFAHASARLPVHTQLMSHVHPVQKVVDLLFLLVVAKLGHIVSVAPRRIERVRLRLFAKLARFHTGRCVGDVGRAGVGKVLALWQVKQHLMAGRGVDEGAVAADVGADGRDVAGVLNGGVGKAVADQDGLEVDLARDGCFLVLLDDVVREDRCRESVC
jgi:hypothetical protein